MGRQKFSVAGDLSRNWQANVAVKSTAMILWVIAFFGFAIVIISDWGFASRFVKNLSQATDATAFRFGALLAEQADPSTPELRPRLEELFSELSNSGKSAVFSDDLIVGTRFVVDGQTYDFGRVIDSGNDSQIDSDSRRIVAATPDAGDAMLSTGGGEVHVFFKSMATARAKRRKKNVLLVIGAITAMGVLSSAMIRNVLAKPFETFIDAIQHASAGELDTRLDVNRQDEFGTLAQFFNGMLAQIQLQQTKLGNINQRLITEIAVRTEAEQDLLNHQSALETVIQNRTKDLAAARDEAVAASKNKNAFVSYVSHEIRTPLTPIIGFADAMWEDASATEKREYLLAIRRNCKQLAQIVNDIIDLSKIEANSFNLECVETDLFELLTEVKKTASIWAKQNGLHFTIELELPLPIKITTDPARLRQILMNLVANAIKFTKQGSVCINARYDEAKGELLTSVRDTGIGIPSSKIDRLFEPFSQVDGSIPKVFGGSGLGLYVSKRLAIMLGGDIAVESISGKGSCFTLGVKVGNSDDLTLTHTLPDNERDNLDTTPRDVPQMRGTVLIAEDSTDIRRFLVYLLEKFGLDVTTVENGQQAFEEATNHHYDIILMDAQMPVLGGLEATMLLRRAGCKTPVVAVTANAMNQDRVNCTQAGCDGFLAKPIDLDELCKMLQRFLHTDSGN